MSYILDALRKSEEERAAAAPATNASASSTGDAGLSKTALIATAMVAVLLGIGATLAWRAATAPRDSDMAVTAPAATDVRAPVPTPTDVPPPAPPSQPLARSAHGPSLDDQLPAPPRPVLAAPAEHPAAPTTLAAAADAPWLRQMPEDFRRGLPPLTINIHVYSPVPEQCVLYINNRSYRVGESVAPGLRLERIVEDGAILRYAGQDFKLPRPN